MIDEPKVSIIIPAFNAEAFLAEAIESALNQDYPRFDVLVIDDGSEDRTAEIATKFTPAIKLIQQRNQGSAASRNIGVALTNAPIISFFDADDLFDPQRVSKQVAALSEVEKVEIAFAYLRQSVINDEKKVNQTISQEDLAGCCVGAMTARRSVFERVGPFDPNLKAAYFLKWFIRAKEIGIGYKVVPETLIVRRIHGENQGLREQQSRTAELAKVLKEALDRRREQD